MPAVGAIEPNFIYAMLKEYHDAVMGSKLPTVSVDRRYLAILQDGTVKYEVPLSCSVSPVTGGAKIVCTYSDTTSNVYTTNGAAYRIRYYWYGSAYTGELFKVSYPAVNKGAQDILHIVATAIVTTG